MPYNTSALVISLRQKIHSHSATFQLVVPTPVFPPARNKDISAHGLEDRQVDAGLTEDRCPLILFCLPPTPSPIPLLPPPSSIFPDVWRRERDVQLSTACGGLTVCFCVCVCVCLRVFMCACEPPTRQSAGGHKGMRGKKERWGGAQKCDRDKNKRRVITYHTYTLTA